MRCVLWALAAISFLQVPVVAQQPTASTSRDNLSPVTTPELWLYSQERARYEDPAGIRRARAEIRANARMYRLESQKFYGYNPSRPIASPIAGMTTYSPMWTSPYRNPYQWSYGYPRSSYNVLINGRVY